MQKKKLLSLLLTLCMVLSCIGFVPAYAEETATETTTDTVKTLNIYVTNGYDPIEGATVTINNESAVTDESGIAVIENIPVSDEVYVMTVEHDYYGTKTYNISVLPDSESVMDYTVSYWTPGSDASVMTMSDTDSDTDYDSWDSDIAFGDYIKAVAYNGYIYLFDGSCAYAFNPETDTKANLGTFGADFVFLYNGAFYSYSVYETSWGEDEDGNDYPTYKESIYRLNIDSSDDTEGYIYPTGSSQGYNATDYDTAVLYGSTIYLIGGEYYPDNSYSLSDYEYIDEYNISSGTFTHGYLPISGNKATAIAGDSDYYVFTSSDNEYREGQSATYVDGKIYLIGGDEDGTDVIIYDTATETSTNGADVPHARQNHAAVYSDGKIYIMGGYDSETDTDNSTVVDIYDIASDSWSMGASAPGSIKKDNAVLIDDQIYTSAGVYTLPNYEEEDPYTPVPQIDAYRSQTLEIDADGNILAWGEGYYADGSDSMKTYGSAHTISGISEPVKVSRGKNHNLVLTHDGDVYGWGSNTNYPMGSLSGKVKTATKLDGISDVKDIAAGTEFSIFVKDDGTVWGVGKNNVGQLGTYSGTSTYTPVQISGISNVESVSVGEDYVLALTTSGTVYAWGNNTKGQLGNGTTTANSTPTAISFDLDDDESIIKIEAGIYFAMALTDQGNVYAWGDNDSGEIGQGNKSTCRTPTKVSTLSDITDIAAGKSHAIAIMNNGEKVYGWGYGKGGQLGFYASGSVLTPKEITSLAGKDIIDVSCGNAYSIFLCSDGTIYSFGTNQYGQLGNGTVDRQLTSSDISSATDISGEYTVSGTISSAADYKVYKYVPEETNTYYFSTTGSTDTEAYLFSSTSTLLQYADSGNSGTNFKLTYDLTAGKTYYLKVKGNSNSAGSYDLYIETPLEVEID